MNNLTLAEIKELIEMGIDPSQVLVQMPKAVDGIKNLWNGTPAMDPSAPPQGGSFIDLSKSKSVSSIPVPQTTSVQNPSLSSQIKMDPNQLQNRPLVTNQVTEAKKGIKDYFVDNDRSRSEFVGAGMGLLNYGINVNNDALSQQNLRNSYQTDFNKTGTKEYYNNDFVGENDPMFFLNSRMGSKVDLSHNPNGVPIEAEGGEFYLDPASSAVVPIQGPSHEEGGVKMVATPGSYILSDNVKVPGSIINGIANREIVKSKKDMTIADAVRKFPKLFDTKKDVESLSEKTLDKVAKDSIEENLRRKTSNLAKLLAYQQTMNGGHGEDKDVARNGMLVADNGIKTMADLKKSVLQQQSTSTTAEPPRKPTGADYRTAMSKATPYEKARLATEMQVKSKEGLEDYEPDWGPFKGLKYKVTPDQVAPKEGESIVYEPFKSVEEATRAAEAATKSGDWSKLHQGHTPGAPDWFAGGINPDLVIGKFGNKENMFKTLGLDSKYMDNLDWSNPEFKKHFLEKFHGSLPQNKFRSVMGNDEFFGQEYYDALKPTETTPPTKYSCKDGKCNPDPNGPYSSIVECSKNCGGEISTYTQETPKGETYKEHLPLGYYAQMLPEMRSQNYLSNYRQERYEPNLVSLRSAKNDQVAAMNSMLQQQGMNPATMAARQASLYGEAAKNIGAITEQENNTNAQILNQAKAQNAQMSNQINAMQQMANKQFVDETNADAAKASEQRNKLYSDLLDRQQDVNTYNTSLQFMDDTFGSNYDVVIDPMTGKKMIVRNQTPVNFGQNLSQLQGDIKQLQELGKPNLDLIGNNASSTPKSRQGLAVRKRKTIFY
jgi:hypothetical protein